MINKEIIEDKIEDSSKYLGKLLKNTKKIKEKKILKKSQMIAKISDYKAPSVLGDENRFFKGTMEKEKRSMFFS